jgi:Holliday junction resolvase-like predicted endonuclease
MPLLGTTLEFVRIPADLLVICFQRSSLARLGLTVSPTVIEPSYEGRLALELVNHGPMPLAIYPGQMIVNLYFAEVRGSKGRHLYHGKYARLPQPDKAESIERLKDLLSEREKRLEARHRASKSIQQLLDFALHSKGPEKGKALERLAVGIFQTIEGLRVLKTNPRLAAEELDIVLQNDIGFGFWRFAGSPIVVECKNWSSKVGSNEIKVLSDNLRTISPDAKTGILVAPNGISGNEHRDALAKVREKRQQGQYIIILDDRDLNEIAQGTPAASVVEMKYTELLLL